MGDQNVEMKIDPVRAKHLVSNLQHISERIVNASKGRNVSCKGFTFSCEMFLLRHHVAQSLKCQNQVSISLE